MRSIKLPTLTLLACSLLVAQPSADAKPAPSAHPLASLNQHARDIYAQARSEIIQGTDPLLVVYSLDQLVLHHRGERKVWTYGSPEVDGLKTVSHMPLAAWTLLSRGVHDPAGWQSRARDFAQDVRRSEAFLVAYKFTPEQLARQKQIMQRVVQAVQPRDKPPTQADADALAKQTASLAMANVTDAAALVLEALNDRTHEIRTFLGAAAFKRLRVVILGSHMARSGEISAQYFQQLFGGEPEGGRWVFSEGTFDEASALSSLSIHLIDNAASTAFFGDAMRLHRDVLSDAARQHLPSMTLPLMSY